MLSLLNTLEKRVIDNLSQIDSEESLVEYKNTILGKTGELTVILKGLKDLSNEEKATVGKRANEIRDSLSGAIENRKNVIKRTEIESKLREEWEDMTIPLTPENGSLHPITQVRMDVEDTFRRMGFDIYESTEVTTEYLNFDAVNVAKNHPARDMQDTFWLEGDGNVLATQTSCMQNLLLKNQEPPIRVIIPGRVFRNEDVDATHENTFYQVEGIVVDKNIGMGHLKFTIKTMLSDLFGKEVTIRMRPGYFPFVEPGVEVDFSCPFCDGEGCRICKKSGWIEFMGAGLIHPNVIREGGLDPEIYSGFAFGFGLNRLVMIKYGIPDMRYFQNPDIRFLRQF
ncbi:MAG: phenylalanine--tRNA ligase subunit alpha [Candidatus Gracilibacteria bacterium]|nr:phenylalanine--tRNA ligase subunit alpha [Candidatus Gracilibacteria bacterium]